MSLFNQFLLWLYLHRGLKAGTQQIWRCWKRARAIYGGPVGYGAQLPLAFKLVQEIVVRFPDAESFFKAGLAQDDPQVVGYSLVGMAMIDREQVSIAKLSRGDPKVLWALGSREMEVSLADIQRFVSERGKPTGSSPNP